MRYIKGLLLLAAVAGLSNVAWADQTKAEVVERLDSASKSLQEIVGAPDKGIPEEVLKDAKCIAVVPSMIKGGFVFGGKHGRGVSSCRLANGSWSAPAFFSISGGSWGAQIGVEDIQLVMMIMNDEGMRNLLNNKFQIGGSASASAGPVGRHASAGTDWKLQTQILTYSRSKGLFAGIDLAGSWIEQDKESTVAMYGHNEPNAAILTGKVNVPAEAKPFVAELRSATASRSAENAR